MGKNNTVGSLMRSWQEYQRDEARSKVPTILAEYIPLGSNV
jgi:hypothetical protein